MCPGELGDREINHIINLLEGRFRVFDPFPSWVVVIPRCPRENASTAERTFAAFTKVWVGLGFI